MQVVEKEEDRNDLDTSAGWKTWKSEDPWDSWSDENS